MKGQGLYDAPIKKIRFTTADGKTGNREVQADWDRAHKAMRVTVPPYQWLFPDMENSDDATSEKMRKMIQRQQAKPIRLQLSLNDQEWIDALQFRYHETNIERLAYAVFDLAATPEDIQKVWCEPEEEWVAPEGITEEELKKREDELAKKAADETEESQTVAKRRATKMYIYGSGFVQGEQSVVSFCWEGNVTKKVRPVFKNARKLAVEIPDMGVDVEIGQHMLTVEVTMNGQQFTTNGVQFLYN